MAMHTESDRAGGRSIPRRGKDASKPYGIFLRTVGWLLLKLGGWTAAGERPKAKRLVVVAAPHTSNWDFVWVLAFATHYQLRISWLGKNTLFKAPFGGFMRWLGGIPVYRQEKTNLVDELVATYGDYEALALTVPPEGTRGQADYWKSGFYHIAKGAGVPILLSYLCYESKTGGFGPELWTSDDVRADMDQIREFYAGKVGKRAGLSSKIRLREEDAVSSTPVE
jgi:1-acyl-sn-glycerol-3-phosphate acyltransferase